MYNTHEKIPLNVKNMGWYHNIMMSQYIHVMSQNILSQKTKIKNKTKNKKQNRFLRGFSREKKFWVKFDAKKDSMAHFLSKNA